MSNSTIIMEHGARSTEHGARPVVSFCIPVYNNAEAALKIVQGILVSNELLFEVIAVDDASTDNAQELLLKIHDSRFRYVRNEKNLGAHRNWLKSLELGRGEWLYLVMGRDRINGRHITRLIELLERARKNRVTLICDGHSLKKNVKTYSGIDAMMKFLSLMHPTGTVLSKEVFDTIPRPVRIKYFTSSDMYPENFLRRDMLLKGNGAMTMSGVFEEFGMTQAPGIVIDLTKIKSSVENGLYIFDTYFAPRRRYKQFYELISMVLDDLSDRFSENEMTRYIASKFYVLLYSVSYLWSRYCENSAMMLHYGQKTRHVSFREMIYNILNAYREVSSFLKGKRALTLARRLRMYWCIAVMLVFAYPAAKTAKFLAQFKIWHNLRRFIKKTLIR